MHELSICEGILQVLEDEAGKQGFSKVKTVWVEIGSLSCIEPDALLFAFDAVTRNSLAADAKLEILTIAGKAWCGKCAKSINIKQRYDECPDCGSVQLQATAGDEMRIKELEVE